MRFLADESCDFAVVRLLRNEGYDVRAVAELCPGTTDQEVMRMAVEEDRVLLTEDRDFGWLVFSGSAHTSTVIYIRFPMDARSKLPQAITQFVKECGARLAGRFIVMQPGRIRVLSVPER